MITQTYQVSSSKHSNICAMSSPKTKHTFIFTPTPNSIPKFENKEEEKCPSLVKSVPFKSKPQKIESDSSEDEYAGLKAKPEDSDEVSAWETPKSRKRTSHCMDGDYDIIECVNQKFKRKISNINNDTLTEYKKKLSSILNGSSNSIRKEILKRKSISTLCIMLNEEEIEMLSSIKEISNFYEYTKTCFKMMADIEKITTINKCTPLSFPFDSTIGPSKRLAVFDLDETLIHCLVKNIEDSQNIIEITLPSRKKGKIGLNQRPHWKEAMDKIKERYEIVVYTASHKSYCDAILDFLDPKGEYFKYRLYRNNCTSVKYNGSYIYIKDLSIFKNIKLEDIIIIDNSVISFTYNLDNGLLIAPYYDSDTDYELMVLTEYLNFIFVFEDLREANRKILKLEYYKKIAVGNTSNSKASTSRSLKKEDSYISEESDDEAVSKKESPSLFSIELKDTYEKLREFVKNKKKIDDL